MKENFHVHAVYLNTGLLRCLTTSFYPLSLSLCLSYTC